MGFPEFGTVRLSELESFRGPLGMHIERDRFFQAKAPISRYIDAANDVGASPNRWRHEAFTYAKTRRLSHDRETNPLPLVERL